MSINIQEKYPVVREKFANNLINMVIRGYMTGGVILAWTYFFLLPKVTDDVCMVFDITMRWLNDFLWGPNSC